MPGEWHQGWQDALARLGGRTEVRDFVAGRRPDVVLDGPSGRSCVVEVQHSYIAPRLVRERNASYRAAGHEVVWIVNAAVASKLPLGLERFFGEDAGLSCLTADGTLVAHLSSLQSFFPGEEDPRSWPLVLLDVGDDQVLPVAPEAVRRLHVRLRAPLARETVLSELAAAWEQALPRWKELSLEVATSRIECRCEPPGSGKTYSVVREVRDGPPEGEDEADCVFFVAKEHAAKDVLHAKWRDSITEPGLRRVPKLVSEASSAWVYDVERSGRVPLRVTFATFDSLVFALTDKRDATGLEPFFLGLYRALGAGKTVVDSSGFLRKFKGQTAMSNLRSRVILDEATKVEPEAAAALEFIAECLGARVTLIGDYLQSTRGDSVLGRLRKRKGAELHPYSLKVRRYGPVIASYVQAVVRYREFEMTLPELAEATPAWTPPPPGIVERHPVGYDEENRLVSEVMEVFQRLAKGRKPSDFMLVFPRVCDPYCALLQGEIDSYWKQRFGVKETCTMFAHLHQSATEGRVQLGLSEDKTRLVYIGTSQGDERPVVLALLPHKALQQMARVVGGAESALVHESLLHVALTRATEELHVFPDRADTPTSLRLKQSRGSPDDVACWSPARPRLSEVVLPPSWAPDSLISEWLETLVNDRGGAAAAELDHHCLLLEAWRLMVDWHVVMRESFSERSDKGQLPLCWKLLAKATVQQVASYGDYRTAVETAKKGPLKVIAIYCFGSGAHAKEVADAATKACSKASKRLAATLAQLEGRGAGASLEDNPWEVDEVLAYRYMTAWFSSEYPPMQTYFLAIEGLVKSASGQSSEVARHYADPHRRFHEMKDKLFAGLPPPPRRWLANHRVNLRVREGSGAEDKKLSELAYETSRAWCFFHYVVLTASEVVGVVECPTLDRIEHEGLAKIACSALMALTQPAATAAVQRDAWAAERWTLLLVGLKNGNVARLSCASEDVARLREESFYPAVERFVAVLKDAEETAARCCCEPDGRASAERCKAFYEHAKLLSRDVDEKIMDTSYVVKAACRERGELPKGIRTGEPVEVVEELQEVLGFDRQREIVPDLRWAGLLPQKTKTPA